MNNWIQIRNNKKFDFNQIDVSNITIEDYAFSISKICRFTGWVSDFYSVAQHSVLLSNLCPPELALPCLLHDIHEALVHDVSTPLKRMLSDYRKMEDLIAEKVYAHFDVEITEEVSYWDKRLGKTEALQLVNANPDEFMPSVEPIDFKITPWSWQESKMRFLDRYYNLRPDECRDWR